jgi:tetratricopeptide (TPR) repeat protein
MASMVRTWIWAFSSVFLMGCGATNQQELGYPNNERQEPTPTIVIAPNVATKAPAKAPVEIAAEEPQVAIVANNQPGRITDADLSISLRDPRRERRAPRNLRLLVTELQTLEALFAQVPKASPDRPKLMRRLAYNYDELKFAARRDKLLGVTDSGRTKAEEAARLDKVIAAAQRMALKYYTMLVDQHPTFCQAPNATDPNKSQGCIDDALYFMSIEYLELDSLDNARKSYFKLIQSFPQSPWIPHAYLGFGELFFSEGAADPSKLDYARQSYEQVLKYPPPQNETYGFAHYRLGQVLHQKNDDQAALAHFVKAIETTTNFASLPSSGMLGDKAREEIIPIYAIVGSSRKAESFFQRLANDPPGSNERVAKMLDALVARYLRDNKRGEAGDVCFDFSGGAKNLPSCAGTMAFQPTP